MAAKLYNTMLTHFSVTLYITAKDKSLKLHKLYECVIHFVDHFEINAHVLGLKYFVQID